MGLYSKLTADAQESRQRTPSRFALCRERLGQFLLIAAPACFTELLVSCNGLRPQVILEGDQLLDMFCQCLREHDPWMSYRFTALPTGEQERCPRIARRQEPGSFVHPQPYALHVLQLRICPGDERGGVPEPTGAHHLHGGYHLANKVLMAFGYAHQFLGGSNDMLFLRAQTRR